jgi:hypothetical protein
MTEIVWTAREAMACALCWAGFYDPRDTGNPNHGSPEAYWRTITERARCDYREAANKQLMLAVARGQAVPIMPPNAVSVSDMQHMGAKMGLKSLHRVRQVYAAVWDVVALKMKA